jgi:predicted DNA-binding transcriptional regulator AlpA
MGVHSLKVESCMHSQIIAAVDRANDDRVLSLAEFAQLAGLSVPTVRRLLRIGDGPTITRLSTRRIGVRIRHGRAWLDARAITR